MHTLCGESVAVQFRARPVFFVGEYRETAYGHFSQEPRATSLHDVVKVFEVQAVALLIFHGTLYVAYPVLNVRNTLCGHNCRAENEPL